jgi:phenylacetate-coenzyme A ligase PaaK-like adenylate-forming protein
MEYQLRKLKETLRLVSEKSAYYKKLYRNFNIDAVKSFADFEKLPFVTAEELAVFGPQMLCVPQNEIERIVTLHTSGTAGEPKRVYFTAADQELTIDFFDVGMRCLIGKKDNFMILLPYKTPGSVGDLLRKGLERIGCGVYPYGLIEDYKNAGEFIIKNNITSLVGNPVQVLKLAELAEMYGIDINLSSILLSTDYVPDAIVQRLAALWQCKVFEHYGMTEMCFGGGVYCECLAGYHMREADLYFEIISDKGETLPEGEYGEVVFTTLTRTGMPLVRYRTGDYGRFKKERCGCGDKLRLMEKIKRRVDGGISMGGKEFYMSDFDEMFFSCDKVIDYNLEFRNGKLNVKFITANDVMKNMENEVSQERLIKRQIVFSREEQYC